MREQGGLRSSSHFRERVFPWVPGRAASREPLMIMSFSLCPLIIMIINVSSLEFICSKHYMHIDHMDIMTFWMASGTEPWLPATIV